MPLTGSLWHVVPSAMAWVETTGLNALASCPELPALFGAAMLMRCTGRELSMAAKKGGGVGRATGFAD